MRKYRLEHREEMLGKKQKYYQQHKKENETYNREYREKHIEEVRLYYREYWEKCKEKRNPEILEKNHKKGIHKRYNLMLGISHTPEYQKIKGEKYKYNSRNAGNLTIQTIQQIYDENIINNGGVLKCIYCHRELTNKEATLEHKQPLSSGGTNAKENLAIACGHCNSGKKDKTEAEYKEWLKNKEGKIKLYSGQ